MALYLKAVGEKLEERSRTTGSRENSGRHAGKRAGDGRQTWNVTRATKKDTSRGSARPTPLKDAREKCRRSWWGTDYISRDGSRGTGSASWSPRDPGCRFWLLGAGGSGVMQKMNLPGTGGGCVRWRDERSSVWAARDSP